MNSADAISKFNDHIIYEFHSIKWYGNYDEVNAVNKFLQHYREKGDFDNKDYVAMVRLGEDLGDVEEVGSPWVFDISVRQEICY